MILGLSYGYHDAAAAIVKDGEVIAAAQEERFSRKKNDPSFPRQAIKFCLDEACIDSHEIEQVIYYERPLLKFERLTETLESLPHEQGNLILKDWLRNNKFDPVGEIAAHLEIARNKVTCISHHESHAAAAFYCSPFNEAAILTIDGVGEYDVATIAYGKGSNIDIIKQNRFPASLGLIYSAFTAFLGFEVNEGEYKVMGMSAFGRPSYLGTVEKMIWCNDQGDIHIDSKYFNFTDINSKPFTSDFIDLFGPPREPESDFEIIGGVPQTKQDQHFADIAASIQKHTENMMLQLSKLAMEETGSSNLCMAGGVALNSVGNGRVQRELGGQVYIQPAAGDGGSAIGAALHYYHLNKKGAHKGTLKHCYLGKSYNQAETLADFDFHRISPTLIETEEELLERTVEFLMAGKVIGWHQGRFEFGPRALGNRSILADPRSHEMQMKVNQKIKFREPFRPFAPAIPIEYVNDFFDDVQITDDPMLEDFMLSVSNINEDKRSVIPAVTHYDGTGRVQVVRSELNPLYHALITAFGKKTNVPVLLNTSFNVRGEPIVASPRDAINTFNWSGLDAVIIGQYILDKNAE